ncbi:hypothetical protein ACCD06_26510 [Azospirillum sp. CT11-132]|jgi:hypothetical protein|uniref:hypothetical protein n=1 Tax=Azospirillum sp. CT11-132 TaxID=3396317 RepID=UPI0039A5E5A1
MQKNDTEVLDYISSGAKDFYSAGTSFSTVGCAAVVAFVWGAMSEVYPPSTHKVYGLIISFIIVFAYALIIPEPKGYPNAGKLRITISELMFGFINSFVVFSTAIALKALT